MDCGLDYCCSTSSTACLHTCFLCSLALTMSYYSGIDMLVAFWLLTAWSAWLQDVKDNHEEAAKVAPQTLQLCQMVSCAGSSLRL